jgi:hypothetical protein
VEHAATDIVETAASDPCDVVRLPPQGGRQRDQARAEANIFFTCLWWPCVCLCSEFLHTAIASSPDCIEHLIAFAN